MPPSGETVRQTPKSFRGARTYSRSSITVPSLVRSDFIRRRGGRECLSFLPAALRAAQICRYLVYSEADFEVFRPAGATRCTDGGQNLARRRGPKVPSLRSPPPCSEIWHGGGDRSPLLRAKFHPHRCNDEGVGPQNRNFYSDLTEMWNINAQQGRIPCAIFTKLAEFVPHFRLRWALKFGSICSRGYGVMGVLI